MKLHVLLNVVILLGPTAIKTNAITANTTKPFMSLHPLVSYLILEDDFKDSIIF